MQLSHSTKQLLVPFIYLALFLGVYTGLTHHSFYKFTIGRFVHPYKESMKEGAHTKDEPYFAIENKRLYNWDGAHYYKIGSEGYSYYDACAFFPLFPWLFKLTGFSWLIILVNFLLFSLSLRYLVRKLGGDEVKDSWPTLLLLIAMPSVFVFFMPYSEGLFFFCFTLCIAGFLNGNKYLLFTGLLLAATTRPIVSIVLLSIIAVEVIRLLQTRSIKAMLNSLLVWLPPMVVGTVFSIYIQYLDTGSFTKFITVQKDVWNHTFRLPTQISDWSDEGHALNVFAILFIVLPVLVYCAAVFIKALNRQANLFSSPKILSATTGEKFRYLTILSAAYVVGSFCFIMLFQGGSLNGMFRYIMCTPFFYILVIAGLNQLQYFTLKNKAILLSITAVLSILFIVWIRWFKHHIPNAMEFSFLLLVAIAALLIVYKNFPRWMVTLAAIGLAILGLFYQTYLFNSFLADSWILT